MPKRAAYRHFLQALSGCQLHSDTSLVLTMTLPHHLKDLRQLRARAVREVKQTNGRINFKDAIDYQRGEE